MFMHMKTKLLLFATALLCLAACNKQEIIDGPDDQGKEGDYMIEIAELDQPTKSNPSTVELNLANLVSPSSKSITAQLKKRSGSSWVNVDNGVSYSWSATSEDNQKFSGSGTVNQSCNVTAKKAGSGNITVSAAIGGTTVATQPVPVNVSDDRALSWTNATTSLTAGEVKTAVLNSNFSGTVTVSSDNSSFLVGTSENSLNATTSVTFSSNKTQTIYYKYTGSSQTTVKIDAQSIGSNLSSSLSVNASAYPQANIKLNVRYGIDFQYYDLFLYYGLNNVPSRNIISFNTAVNSEDILELHSVESNKTSSYTVNMSSQISLRVNTTFNVTTTMVLRM